MLNHLAHAAPSDPELHINAGRYAGPDAVPLWLEQPLAMGSDLHPVLAEALGLRRDVGQPAYWQLNNAALEDINRRISLPQEVEAPDHGETARNARFPAGYGLAIQLSKAACARLGRENDDRTVPIRIAAIEFYMSQTRLGQFVVELACGREDVRADLATEVLHHLARANQPSQSADAAIHRVSTRGMLLESGGEGADVSSFTLRRLALDLACPARAERCIVAVPRAFSYALATTAGPMAEGERHELAARLARRMNADYAPVDALEGVAFAESFRTVTHACSIEGGAVLVSGAASVGFLRDFADSVGPSVYLKLALLANKNMHDLVALSQGSAITFEHSDRIDNAVLDSKLAQLERIEDRVLNYRLAHRFSIAGFGTNQNLVHQAWRQATHSDLLLRDVSEDVALASAYLGAARERLRIKAEQETHNRIVRNASWLKAGLAFLAAIEGMHAMLLILGPLLHRPTAPMAAAERIAQGMGVKLLPLPATTYNDILFEAAPLIVATVASIGVWYFSRRTEVHLSE